LKKQQKRGKEVPRTVAFHCIFAYAKSNIQKICILADHQNMVKFSQHNYEYRQKVEPALSEMISNIFIERSQPMLEITEAIAAAGLLRAPRQNLQSSPRQPVLNISEISDTEQSNFRDGTDENAPRQAVVTSLDGVSESDARAWLEGVLQELSFMAVEDQFFEIKNALNGTCEWIQDKPSYKQWLDSRKNAVLFI
jgi:hypothetical protein